MRFENDGEIFSAGYPGIVPFLMEEYRGEVSFEVYEGIRTLAETFRERYKGRYFGREALTFIARGTDAYLEKNGYERDTVGMTRYYYQYELTPEDSLDRSLIGQHTFRLREELLDGINENLTTFDLEELLKREIEAFVVIADGKVAAIATVNERFEEGSMPEVTVETAPAYRRRGYALSAVAALCDFLLSQGCSVAYCCRNTHTSSNHVASRIGFTRVGRFYAVAAYRKQKKSK